MLETPITYWGVQQNARYCVYCHTSLDTGLKYVGTTIDISRRWNAAHYKTRKISDAIKEAATRHNVQPNEAFKDYFHHEILFESDDQIAVGVMEAYYTGNLNTYANGLNGGYGGELALNSKLKAKGFLAATASQRDFCPTLVLFIRKLGSFITNSLFLGAQRLARLSEKLQASRESSNPHVEFIDLTPLDYSIPKSLQNSVFTKTKNAISSGLLLNRIKAAEKAGIKKIVLRYAVSRNSASSANYYKKYSRPSLTQSFLPTVRHHLTAALANPSVSSKVKVVFRPYSQADAIEGFIN